MVLRVYRFAIAASLVLQMAHNSFAIHLFLRWRERFKIHSYIHTLTHTHTYILNTDSCTRNGTFYESTDPGFASILGYVVQKRSIGAIVLGTT